VLVVPVSVAYGLSTTTSLLGAFDIATIPLLSAKTSSNIAEFLQSQLKEIEDGRFEVCDAKDKPIQNIIDEIVGLYLTTLYKLKFLS